MNIPDQRPVWDKKHLAAEHNVLRGVPSPLAELAEPYFPRGSEILELGCGVGRDANFFAEKGHRVIATDGSEVVIRQNTAEATHKGVHYGVIDMREPLPYGDDSFDTAYANLSLHYYADAATKAIVHEIARVLKSDGLFAFACKSYDSLHTSGKEVEPGVFVSPNGVTIHLFSIDYAQEVLQGLFTVIHLDEIDEEYAGRHSKIVRCIAKKSGNTQ